MNFDVSKYIITARKQIKNIIMKRLLFIGGLLFLTMLASAQKSWSLKECIAYALEHNIDVKKLQLQQNVVQNELSRSKHAVLPTVYGYGNYNSLSVFAMKDEASGLIDEHSGSGNLGVAVELDLFKGLYNYNNIKKYNLLLTAAGHNLETTKNNIMLEVGTAFMYVIYNKERLNTVNAQMERTAKQIEKSKKFFDAGESTQADLLKIEAQLVGEELEKTIIENDIANWKLSLAQAMEVSLDSISDITLGLEIPEINNSTVSLNIDSLFTKACSMRPEVLAGETYIQSKKYDIALAKSAAMPSLSLGYNTYSSLYSPGYYNSGTGAYYEEMLFDNYYGNLSVHLTIPIFNKFNTKHEVVGKHIEKKQAEYELISVKKELYNAISVAFQNLESAKKEFEKQQKLLELTEKTFDYADRQNEVGAISSIDYLLEKNRLNEAETGLLVSKYEYLFHKMILEFYASNQINL